jgi:hypothetical protein
MFLFLMIAKPNQTIAESGMPRCEHLSPKRVSLEVSHIANIIDLTPIYANRDLGNLKTYWESTCATERLKAKWSIVRQLSSLLSREQAILTVSSMLVDVGQNLSAARRNVDNAIRLQSAREDARMRAASPIMPGSGYALSYALKCIRVKIATGSLVPHFCRYLGR